MNLTGAETAPNIAEVTVEDDRVAVALEVFIDDLRHFEPLIPDAWTEAAGLERPPLEVRMRHFSQTGLQFVTETGERLAARLERAEPRARVDRRSPFAGMINPTSGLPVPDAPTDQRVLYAELTYPFPEGAPRPQRLTLIPPLDAQGKPLVSIGFIAYHGGVPIIDFRYLGAPSTLRLDWDDPWYSRFDNPNLKRHHESALMSFLYVEPYEVRHEILTRVRDLEAWMDLGLRGSQYIELDELRPLKERIGAFLVSRNPVRIDGETPRPILDRVDYVRVALTGIQPMERPEPLDVDSAIVGVIISYVTQGLPREVTVDWELFTDQIQRVPAVATDPAGPLPTFLTPQDTVHTWSNSLKHYALPTVHRTEVAGSLGDLSIPVVSVLCLAGFLGATGWTLSKRRRARPLRLPLALGALCLASAAAAYPLARVSVERPALLAAELTAEQARALLQVLLRNVYRAFDFRAEEDVYDKLAVSVAGDQLAELYLQNRRSFAIQQAGGAQAKVQSVEVGDAVAERQPGQPLSYAIRADWTAQGSVGHWGHVHTRRNRYDAVVRVSAIDGAWKITGLEVRDEQRVDPTLRTAGAAPSGGSARTLPR